jgi:hypothetical protein
MAGHTSRAVGRQCYQLMFKGPSATSMDPDSDNNVNTPAPPQKLLTCPINFMGGVPAPVATPWGHRIPRFGS